MLDVEVRRDDLRTVRAVERPDPEPADGEVVLRVERFGFTANNVTYAALGDMLRYWEFFPREEGWGQIPVWGFGEVVASAAPELDAGARLFGYLPMSTHMRLVPSRVGETGLTDATEHRSTLPSAYNAYRFAPPDPATDDFRALLTPPFALGFLLDDALEDAGDHGTTTAIVSSASSKTAIATAFQLAQRGVDVVGLTSARNAEFVRGLDPYASVVTYDALDELADEPSMYLDISGDAAVRRGVHERLGDALRHSSLVGATHWEGMQEAPDAGDLPGPAPAMFFAPDRMVQRAKDWGPDGLEERMATALMTFAGWTGGWLTVEHVDGGDAVQAAYLQVLEGKVAPDTAHVLTL
jgi:hypothetical protein